ncbi:hydrogenase maturation nickel metallochaperone HypA/HybF [Ferruginibacter profundus]
MHELSIVMSIVDIAQQQAAEADATTIEEIEIDIGCLSTIEMNAFEFAWRQGVKQTILEPTLKKINRIKGKATCLDCNAVFAVDNVYDACPVCKGHFINITAGKELRVRSLVVAEE